MSSEAGKVLDSFEHALHRPDTYIGSVKTSKRLEWVWGTDGASQEEILFNPGLFNAIREIGSNIIDNKWRGDSEGSPPMKKIVITMDPESGRVTFWNDGRCIPVHKETYKFRPPFKEPYTLDLYPSVVFFAHMGAGTNFNDTEERKTSGRNGMGAKLANVFSTEFEVENVDPRDNAKFFQKHWSNGQKSTEPKVTKCTNKTGYTRISFVPDYKYFNFPSKESPRMTEDLIGVVKMYAAQIAMFTGIPVTFNGKKLAIKNLEQYARLFYKDRTNHKLAVFKANSGDECVVVEGLPPQVDSKERVEHISFVNGIQTFRGGVHVKKWESSIITPFVTFFNKRPPPEGEKKALRVSGDLVKPYFTFFIRADVSKPQFGTQTKDELTDPPYKISLTKAFKAGRDSNFKKMMKWNFIELLEDKLASKLDQSQRRKEGTRKRVTGKGVSEANKAGTKESSECTLCIAEGLSAKAFVDRGIGSIRGAKGRKEYCGQDYYGSLAIRGKFMNVQNSATAKINANKEIHLIKQMLGLRRGMDYSKEENFKTLRYGKVWLVTDADDDGIHIRGLLIQFFYREYPTLVARNFLEAFNTAVVKAFLGKKKCRLFYSIPQFKGWNESHPAACKGKPKYYKGLGSINPKDAPGYFRDPKVVSYFIEGDEEEYMNLGFDKDASDQRKDWITRDMTKDPDVTDCIQSDDPSDSDEEIDLNAEEDSEGPSVPEVSQTDFVYEGRLSLSTFVDQQLIIYHKSAIRRSIPGIFDGFKEGQRKVLYAIRKAKFKNTRDLERVAGLVKQETGYHHGAISLQKAIIKMAQGYVGSNNIPLLVNDGEMGCVDPETPVLLWSGTVKPARNVIKGDILIGDDGCPRTVKSLTNGKDEMYTVNQTFGNSYKVNSCHILTLKYSGHKTIRWKKSGNMWVMAYFNPEKFKVEWKSISAQKSNHHNSSKLTKTEAHAQLQEIAKTIPDEWAIFDIDIQKYLSLSASVRQKLKGVKNSTPIIWPKRRVPIDPYIFGLWLGDGNHRGRGFSTEDPEIVKEWVKWTDTIGVEVVHYKNTSGEQYLYGLRRRGTKMNGRNKNIMAIGSKGHSSEACIGCQTSSVKHPACDWVFDRKCNKSSRKYDYQNKNGVIRDDFNPFIGILKDNGLFKNKHIPIEYVINDEDTRLKLLAGLIDSDGTVRQSVNVQGISISQEEKAHGHIIDSAQYIARSLGYRAEVGIRVCKRKNGNQSTMKELTISGNNLHRIPTKVLRKKLVRTVGKRNALCCKITVEPAGKGEFVGWEIDGNERFLLGDFTVTHNTRAEGGSDHAAPRYPATMLEDITSFIFPSEDDPLLERLVEDNEEVEFSTFMPVIPMLLVNGANGVGVGWRCDIPQYNPLDLVRWIEVWLDDPVKVLSLKPLIPWYRGFTGEIELTKTGWISKGILEKGTKKDKGWWHVRELPIGLWTNAFRDWLEYLESGTVPKDKKWAKSDGKWLKNFKNYGTTNTVHFMIQPAKNFIPDMTVPKNLKIMQTSKSFKNMVAIDERGYPYRFKKPEEILLCFCHRRLKVYAQRKEYLLKMWQKDLCRASNRYRFVKAVGIDRKLDLHSFETDEELYQTMIDTWEFDKVDDSFDYLLNMQVRSFTKKKAADLANEKSKARAKLVDLKAKTAKDLWREDLEKFKVAYKKFLRTRCEE